MAILADCRENIKEALLFQLGISSIEDVDYFVSNKKLGKIICSQNLSVFSSSFDVQRMQYCIQISSEGLSSIHF